jgi:hypothetical protein
MEVGMKDQRLLTVSIDCRAIVLGIKMETSLLIQRQTCQNSNSSKSRRVKSVLRDHYPEVYKRSRMRVIDRESTRWTRTSVCMRSLAISRCQAFHQRRTYNIRVWTIKTSRMLIRLAHTWIMVFKDRITRKINLRRTLIISPLILIRRCLTSPITKCLHNYLQVKSLGNNFSHKTKS